MTIKRLREARGLTQAELATRARTHRMYISQLERSARTPSMKMLQKIASALRVSVAELVK